MEAGVKGRENSAGCGKTIIQQCVATGACGELLPHHRGSLPPGSRSRCGTGSYSGTAASCAGGT